MYKVILAAVDSSARAAGVLAAALEIADRFGGTVHLFQSVEVPQEFPAAAHMPPDELGPHLRSNALRSLTELAGGRPGIVIEPPDMETHQPWRAVLHAAVRLNADLIVIGSHGHSGWDRILATNASRVTDFAHRNVLIVHERTNVPAPHAISAANPGNAG